MRIEVEAVECLHDDHDDCDRDGESARDGPRREAPDDESDQAIGDDSAHHVPTRKAVEPAASAQQISDAGPILVRDGSRRTRVVERDLVQDLEDHAAGEGQHHQRVSAEASSP